MSYLGELRANWRALAAAALGLACGYQINIYITNVFFPPLLQAFGWSKAQISLSGAAVLMTVIFGPFAGRLADAIGTFRMALIGVIASPLLYLGFAAMNGDLRLFLALSALQVLFLGLTTTSIVYSRLVAHQFDKARGVALSLAACAPALAAAVAAPLFANVIEAYGWRAGYVALAVFTGVGGVATLGLIPKAARAARTLEGRPMRTASLYRDLLRSRPFGVIMLGMLLCNLPMMTQASQLSVILIERGLDATAAAWMISLYASAVIVGRLLCGLALDRWPTHLVVTAAMCLPGVGLLILASGLTAPPLLGAAMAVLGFSLGAEVDIMAFVVMRYFGREVFSSVIGLVGAAVALAGTIGALLLSWTLQLTGAFAVFLSLAGVAALLGGATFLLLATSRPAPAGRLNAEPTRAA